MGEMERETVKVERESSETKWREKIVRESILRKYREKVVREIVNESRERK